jgi:AcrR family transcriptional regulator
MESPRLELAQPTTPKGRKTQERIIKAARKVFGTAGFVSMRMGDVAVEAAVSMGALYRYFTNKDDLFLAVIYDIHQDLYRASQAGPGVSFREDPRSALHRANSGYLRHYSDNRAVMRAFIEATMVDTRYRDMWWYMRERHINRFVGALEGVFGIQEINGCPIRTVVEALASMTEQSAYAWFAEESLNATPTSLDLASAVITNIWYSAIFGSET